MSLTIFVLITFVARVQSGLFCNHCFSTVDWNGCLKTAAKEYCPHYCFLLETLDPSSQTLHYRQGCTDDKNLCTFYSSDLSSYCSLCSEDNTLCTSVSHRIGTNVTTTTSKPSQTTASTATTMASSKNGSDLETSLTDTIQKELSQFKNASQIWLHDFIDYFRRNSHTDEKSHTNVTTETSPEANKSSTESTTVKCSTAAKTTENLGTMATTSPPDSVEPGAGSGSNGLSNHCILGVIGSISFIVVRI